MLSVPSKNSDEGEAHVLPIDSASPYGAISGAKIAKKMKTYKVTIPIFAESGGFLNEF